MKKIIETWLNFLFIAGFVMILATSCKKEKDTNDPPQSVTVKDIDGNIYTTVTIGTQVWMVENLKTTKYNDGTNIPNVTANAEWYNLDSPGYCWYDNNGANKITYGALYNWYAGNSGKLAPTGWHVPTEAEWETLKSYMSANRGTSDFIPLFGGFRSDFDMSEDNSFGDIVSSPTNGYGNWWSSSEFDSVNAWHGGMGKGEQIMGKYYSSKQYGYSVRCVKGEVKSVVLPLLSTSVISNITSISAVSGGNITNDGGGAVTARGVCWNTNPNPTIHNNKTTDTNGMVSFSGNLSGLDANTTYYVKAYATNSAGTGYGNEVKFISSELPNCGSVTDIVGNVYHTITIGTQCWMVENLKTTKYRNGDPIPNVSDDTQWSILTTGAYCNYNNEAAIGNKYGGLYNWYAVNDSRNIAPIGWHVATDEEWTTLTNNVASNPVTSETVAKALAARYDWILTTAATYAIGNDLTKNNVTGFSALPSGFRSDTGPYIQFGFNCYWWSPKEVNGSYTGSAYYRSMEFWVSMVMSDELFKGTGLSVRCIKD